MSHRFLAVVFASALAACSGDGATADEDVPGDTGASDAPIVDATAVDLGATDARVVDADRGATDASTVTDAGTIDAGAIDAGAIDASAIDAGAIDAGAIDIPPAVDAPAVTDVPAIDRGAVDVGVDAARDVGGTDVGCAGGAPAITVTAPLANAEIETCSATDQAVSYDFAATVSSASAIGPVAVRWITPDGLEAAPSASGAAAPYRFARQVGGPSAGTPALSVFGIRGTWHVEFAATDACGRRTVASQPFTLIFTNRRCPNP